MSKLKEKLLNKEKVFTAEVAPPKGCGIKKLLERATLLSPYVDAINITDCQRSLVRMSSLASSKILKDKNIEPVYQLTCRDRNSIALQADLMGAWALGIENVLCLTGDPVKVGDSTQSKSVFEMEATGLLKIVRSLQTGEDQNGHKLNKKSNFFVGAVVNPTVQSEGQWRRMQTKIENGAQFFQTQANYDVEDLKKFLTLAQETNAFVIVGILILNSYETAQYIQKEIPGISLPDSTLKILKESGENAAKTGIDLAVETMLQVQNMCHGFHLMSIRAEELIVEVIKKYVSQKNSSISLS